MKNFFVTFLLSPFFCFAQHKQKEFVSLAFGYDLPSNSHVISGQLATNHKVSQDVYLGIGFGVAKFENNKKLYIPVYGNIAILAGNKSKTNLLLMLQPGYGIYSQATGIGPLAYKTTGGFYLHTSIGAALPPAPKLFASIGYTLYSFKALNYTSTTDGLGLRIGFLF